MKECRSSVDSFRSCLFGPGDVDRFDLEIGLEHLANDGASGDGTLATIVYEGDDGDFRIFIGREGCVPGVGRPLTWFA